MESLNTMLIEIVGNGYIVSENYYNTNPHSIATVGERKVFESTENLKKYIDANFSVPKENG